MEKTVAPELKAEDKSRYIARYVGTMGLMGSLHVLVGCVLWFRPEFPVQLGNFFPTHFGWGATVPPTLASYSQLAAALAFLQAILCFLSAFFYRSWAYRGVLLGTHGLILGLAIWAYTLRFQMLFLVGAATEGLLLLWVASASLSLLYHRVFSPPRPTSPPGSRLPPLSPSKA